MTCPLPPPPQAPGEALTIESLVEKIRSRKWTTCHSEGVALLTEMVSQGRELTQQTEALGAENARLTEHVRLHEEAKANWLAFQQEREATIAQLRAQLQESAERERLLKSALEGMVGTLTEEQIQFHEAVPPYEDTNYPLGRAARILKSLTAHPPQTAGEKET